MTDEQKPPPLEEQPRPPTEEEARAEAAILVEAAERYKDAYLRSLPTNAQGQAGVNPVQMAMDIKVQQIRLDALMTVLEQLAGGSGIMLPVTRMMAVLYEEKTAALGKIQIARGVGDALNKHKRGN